MADPFIAQITMFGGNFAPRGWAFCDGQLLPISQYQALFSLLGTTYGGDGRTTFALPDLRSRSPLHEGHGPGLSDRRLGSKSGSETVALTAAQIPAHAHIIAQPCNTGGGDQDGPAENVMAEPAGGTAGSIYHENAEDGEFMKSFNSSSVGGSQAHNNMHPYLAINFIIALTGVFPSRN